MHPFARSLASALLCVPVLWFSQATAQESCPGLDEQSDYFRWDLSPSIRWSALAPILGVHWKPNQIVAASWFDKEQVRLTLESQGRHRDEDSKYLTGSLAIAYWRENNYVPLVPPTDQKTAQAYDEAAALFHQRDWPQAISHFDEISRDQDSLYRAAASYSAARASIYAGNWRESIDRIDRLVSDPAMHEFHLAGYHLIGTVANQSGAAGLVAARLAEISHLISAPEALLCRESQLQNLSNEAIRDWRSIAEIAFPRENLYGTANWTPHTRQVIDEVALSDPLIDLLRVFAAPTPYIYPYGWLPSPQIGEKHLAGYEQPDLRSKRAAAEGGADLTDHARAKFVETGNPLWAYALAMRTNQEADISLVHRARLAEFPAVAESTWIKQSRQRLRSLLLAQEVRLLLMSGKTEDALRAIDPKILESDGLAINPWSIEGFIVNGGARFFLERQDLDGARHWVEESQRNLHGNEQRRVLDHNIALLLTTDWDEFIAADTSTNLSGFVIEGAPSQPTAFDFLPADKLIALSRRDKLPVEYRRSLLSAAWVRLYLLGRWQDFLHLFPDIRSAFPELATDLDNIDKAWTDTQRHHLVTRLLLRAPGLGPRVSWERKRDARFGTPTDLFSINSYNPSDGNWWCPLDVRRTKMDLLGQFFNGAVRQAGWDGIGFSQGSYTGVGWRGEPDSPDDASYGYLTGFAERLLQWHPLFKDADLSELNQLSKIKSGPRQLTEEAVIWSQSAGVIGEIAGLDELLPETLYLAVRSTRYGCRLAGGHAEYSRAAWTALHKNFPDSEWTHKTKYWFDRFPTRTEMERER